MDSFPVNGTWLLSTHCCMKSKLKLENKEWTWQFRFTANEHMRSWELFCHLACKGKWLTTGSHLQRQWRMYELVKYLYIRGWLKRLLHGGSFMNLGVVNHNCPVKVGMHCALSWLFFFPVVCSRTLRLHVIHYWGYKFSLILFSNCWSSW